MGKLFWEAPWWNDSPVKQELLKQAVQRAASGEFVRFETEHIDKDGRRIPIDFSLTPIFDASKNITFLVPEGRPIQEQVQQRLALEQLFESTFEQAAVGIAHVDEHGKWLRLNQKFCNILGYTHTELMSMAFQDVTYPDDLDADLALYERLKKKEIPSYTLEKRYIRKDGSISWIKLVASIAWSETGQFQYAIAVVIDINEQKKTEATLKQTLQELNDIKRAIDVSTLVAITDNRGVITYVNDAFCTISQYSRKELLGKTHKVVNSNYHSKEFIKAIWDTISTGKIWKGEIRNRRKDGTIYWVDSTIYPFLDADGKPYQYIAIRHDITSQKMAEAEVQKLNAQLEKRVVERTLQLEESNQSLIWEINERRKTEEMLRQTLRRESLTKYLLQVMNQSFDIPLVLKTVAEEVGTFFGADRCLMIRYEKEGEEIKQLRLSAEYCRSAGIKPVEEDTIPWKQVEQLKYQASQTHPYVFLNAPDASHFPATIKPYLESYGVQSCIVVEISFRKILYGRLVLHQCLYPRVWTEEEVAFLETLVTHIGSVLYQAELYQQEKQAKHEAEEANRQKTKVLSFVSHDFKNPLSSMKRFVEILAKESTGPLSENQHELLGYISEGIGQMRSMLTEILDRARMEQGKVTSSPTWIELKPFLDQLNATFIALTSPQEIELSLDIQAELTSIHADPIHLRQILINLVSNAAKYNHPHGKVFMRFYQEPSNKACVIEVTDTGIGIPSDKLNNLFSEYYRTDLSQAHGVEGTGLGLAFIKKLVELQGGKITVESEVGVGSTFKVTLPLNHTPPPEHEAV